jgi:hypothetical protein
MAVPHHRVGMDGFADRHALADDKIDAASLERAQRFAEEPPVARAAKFLTGAGGAEIRFEGLGRDQPDGSRDCDTTTAGDA